MPTKPRVVVREDNNIRFVGSVNERAHREFMWCVHDCLKRGYQDMVLDFSKCQAAFPSGMLSILSSADTLRRDTIDISISLPEDTKLERLFLNTNWAHLLEPERFQKSDTVHDRHMASQRFTDFEQQQALVNMLMDIVMRNMILDRRIIAGLEWSINEITDNVLNHAMCKEGGIIHVSTFRDSHKVAFGVSDSGRGILASLREGHPSLQTDAQAIDEAMKAGITRDPDAAKVTALREPCVSLRSRGDCLKLHRDRHRSWFEPTRRTEAQPRESILEKNRYRARSSTLNYAPTSSSTWQRRSESTASRTTLEILSRCITRLKPGLPSHSS